MSMYGFKDRILVKFHLLLFSCIALLSVDMVFAQEKIDFRFSDTELTDGKPIILEAFEYKPSKWNGRVVLMSHGSTGGDRNLIKKSYDFQNIAKEFTDNGYHFITYMRKGRGNSEGSFTEESGRCDRASLRKEKSEAEKQTDQVIEQIKNKYGVAKVVLVGHSRGGFLSATYAAKNLDKVSAVINLAGAWSAICEGRNGGVGRIELADSAKNFKNQFWFYFERDSFFVKEKFNDPDYDYLSSVAKDFGLLFLRINNYGVWDGHHTPLQKPWTWSKGLFGKLEPMK